MTPIVFHRDGWIEGPFDDAADAATLTRLRVQVGQSVLTKNFSKRAGGESDSVNVSLLPLATHLASLWWPLLYEPLRRSEDALFQARHRLDTPMHGYAFPAMAICSAGDEAVMIDWALESSEIYPIEFRTPKPLEPAQISRDAVESVLMDLVETTIDRISGHQSANSELYDMWSRVTESMSSAKELAYCMASGRLGLDPYDADGPDISHFILDLAPSLFDDISDAANISELPEVTRWASTASKRLMDCPTVAVDAFGPPPIDNLQSLPGIVGFAAAKHLRSKLGLHKHPKKAVAELLGDAVNSRNSLAKRGPSSLTAMVERGNGVAHIGAVAMSARQQRFRACAGVYLAWLDDSGDDRAGTTALTRRQQASRAFAAEMLAPRDVLLERAGPYGFTADDVERQASELICPYETVMWQSARAKIPLRGVDVSLRETARLF